MSTSTANQLAPSVQRLEPSKLCFSGKLRTFNAWDPLKRDLAGEEEELRNRIFSAARLAVNSLLKQPTLYGRKVSPRRLILDELPTALREFSARHVCKLLEFVADGPPTFDRTLTHLRAVSYRSAPLDAASILDWLDQFQDRTVESLLLFRFLPVLKRVAKNEEEMSAAMADQVPFIKSYTDFLCGPEKPSLGALWRIYHSWERDLRNYQELVATVKVLKDYAESCGSTAPNKVHAGYCHLPYEFLERLAIEGAKIAKLGPAQRYEELFREIFVWASDLYAKKVRLFNHGEVYFTPEVRGALTEAVAARTLGKPVKFKVELTEREGFTEEWSGGPGEMFPSHTVTDYAWVEQQITLC